MCTTFILFFPIPYTYIQGEGYIYTSTAEDVFKTTKSLIIGTCQKKLLMFKLNYANSYWTAGIAQVFIGGLTFSTATQSFSQPGCTFRELLSTRNQHSTVPEDQLSKTLIRP